MIYANSNVKIDFVSLARDSTAGLRISVSCVTCASPLSADRSRLFRPRSTPNKYATGHKALSQAMAYRETNHTGSSIAESEGLAHERCIE